MEEQSLHQGMTVVLVMVNPFAWVAYLDQQSDTTAEGNSAHEALKNLIKRLQPEGASNEPAAPPISGVKFIRLPSAG